MKKLVKQVIKELREIKELLKSYGPQLKAGEGPDPSKEEK